MSQTLARAPRLALLLLAAALLLPHTAQAQLPQALAFQGYLEDDTGPLDGTVALTVRLFTEAAGGTQRWARPYPAVDVSGGVFGVRLEGGEPDLSAVGFTEALWVELEVGGEVLAPRTALSSVPYARMAQAALSVPGLRIEPETATEGPNVIGGWSGNYVASGVEGATIAGGGDPIDPIPGAPLPNRVSGDYGTVGGGLGNAASFWATVGGGEDNTASGTASTVGGGMGNTASGPGATVDGGFENTASGALSTVGGGNGNKTAGYAATIPGGESNLAEGNYSFAAGKGASALHSGTFVWADGTGNPFESTAPNQFLIRATRGVGIGTNEPRTQLHVTRAISAGATPDNHVALFENTAVTVSNGPDVLALKTSHTAPNASTNFITFFDGNDQSIGAVEANGSSGVVYQTSSADYAELLPRLDPDEAILPGDVVGVYAGRVSRRTHGAERVMAVTRRPSVLGNVPSDAAQRARMEQVAFVGQVPVRVQGPVAAGDYVLSSGREDGTAVAVAVAALRAEDLPRIVGRAWEGFGGAEVREVNVLVGIGEAAAVPPLLVQMQRDLDALRAEVARLARQQTASAPVPPAPAALPPR